VQQTIDINMCDIFAQKWCVAHYSHQVLEFYFAIDGRNFALIFKKNVPRVGEARSHSLLEWDRP
jgi:hypothetical protein